MTFKIYLVVITMISAVFGQAPNSDVPYSLTISAPSTTIPFGKPVEVQITLENLFKDDLTIVKSRPTGLGELTYDVAVVTTAGGPVTFTPYGRALHGQPTTPPIIIPTSPHEVTLKPHDKVTDTVLLNKIYDLRPGSYVVRVRKTQVINDPEPDIVSNALRINISPQ